MMESKDILTNLYKNKNSFLLTVEQREKFSAKLKLSEIPGSGTENWREFRPKPIFNHKYKLGKKLSADENILKTLSFYEPSANNIIIVNGNYDEKKSFVKDEKVIVSSIKAAKEKYKDIFDNRFGKTESKNENFFSLLNKVHSEDGFFLYIPDNAVVEETIYIMHFVESDNGNIFSQDRNLIIAGKNTAFKVVHFYYSLLPDFSFTNSFTEVFADENANIEYYLFEGEGNTAAHINNMNAELKKNSFFKANVITLCGSVVRNNFEVNLKGKYSEADLSGIYMPEKEQYIDNFAEVIHTNSDCRSNQLFKGVIDNKAVSVFTGKVYVAKNAQKTDSAQSNQNLLLTDSAKAYSRPQLEIYADDVACSHGSTTGQIDKEALFYLKTRGIPEQRAKTMLTKAFLRDVTDKINVENYRDYVNFLISRRLKGQSAESLCMVKVCPSCS